MRLPFSIHRQPIVFIKARSESEGREKVGRGERKKERSGNVIIPWRRKVFATRGETFVVRRPSTLLDPTRCVGWGSNHRESATRLPKKGNCQTLWHGITSNEPCNYALIDRICIKQAVGDPNLYYANPVKLWTHIECNETKIPCQNWKLQVNCNLVTIQVFDSSASITICNCSMKLRYRLMNTRW